MKEQSNIPTSKVERAGKFVTTGLKVGTNYIKHYTRKLMDPSTTKEELHQDNAADIYDTLSNLKGSALKVAQMLSMDKGMLPKAYTEKFAMSQYSAPPLSGPLVVNTFVKTLGKSPSQLYDQFDLQASNAASIGQVHKATKNGKKLAVKIQYPGVANSVKSDLRMVKPFAIRIVGMNEVDMDKYFDEIESKLLEETDYALELRRSMDLSRECAHIPNLKFPGYYPELSSDRIITMDWLDGQHLKEFLLTNPSQEVRDKIGQALWDFYQFQVHSLKQVHADPHPGNFLMRPDGTVGIFDFGCVKEIPEDFYENYFLLVDKEVLKDEKRRHQIYTNLEMIHPSDTPKEVEFFSGLFQHMIDLLTLPFTLDNFDFGNEVYFNEIYAYMDELYNMKEIRDSKVARGSRHSLYINRTYFGLYSILSDLKANVITGPARIQELMDARKTA
ncbi:Predicted unusual protein kinase regulating ubiquinone biosynthesis, AarF/ABC1/UbiB family [Chitinophaga ginsengisegetis]|uniref:Predicted unusual protein kinase regulating ubiquinone biosynthesis, AarF/ABC1/UbiB family n=1 Tax=Chitinophaga ginsengisegetis TaxID=393003 RepID=A0A1T5NX24_9BACT|nr:AarF/ABC1/UbiB kinase family protein [Chitinophaga ginsengisegetis]MDR6567291.1 putative unusual protein kinase regulating ubiquinone biosynthesis (AarF/ABC1/UbiB family) [Chitinophaga ginsengisegetis]MDR6647021.1 putative unusual protein kinase regulating ubiquinone biosynthesis (AarF/ABC1/UbiB family) [Chitinophaga ginsengisegetis]MDR6653371.1 putative unusual protein kinase regulating ubiquinone biosynthesis (AarF/ABC1/UbiB family) [Chitinophaga ginsengisegetis]SKD04916.1 Predicted unusua